MDEISEVRRIIAEADPDLGWGGPPSEPEEGVFGDPVRWGLHDLCEHLIDLVEWNPDAEPDEWAAEARRCSVALSYTAPVAAENARA